jgi:hypothetical protein
VFGVSRCCLRGRLRRGLRKKNNEERKETHISNERKVQVEVKHYEITCMWIGNIFRLCQTCFLKFDIVKWNKI